MDRETPKMGVQIDFSKKIKKNLKKKSLNFKNVLTPILSVSLSNLLNNYTKKRRLKRKVKLYKKYTKNCNDKNVSCNGQPKIITKILLKMYIIIL